MRQTRLQIAKPDIVRLFDAEPRRIYSRSALDAIVQQNRTFWRLAQRATAAEVIDFLASTSRLKATSFTFPDREDLRYVWGEAPFLEVVLSLYPRAYLSHFTAMKALGLTDQIPKTLYINYEQPGRSDPDSVLRQSAIDAAFARPQRVSNKVATCGEYRITVLRGQNTGSAGVTSEHVPDVELNENALVRVTNIERTLIDITVRPAYSGGVGEVLNAYRNAVGLASVNRLAALLRELAYVYPYHQAIGFYLERAGFNDSAVQLLREMPRDYDFYLTHEMKDAEYLSTWRLYVPKGL